MTDTQTIEKKPDLTVEANAPEADQDENVSITAKPFTSKFQIPTWARKKEAKFDWSDADKSLRKFLKSFDTEYEQHISNTDENKKMALKIAKNYTVKNEIHFAHTTLRFVPKDKEYDTSFIIEKSRLNDAKTKATFTGDADNFNNVTAKRMIEAIFLGKTGKFTANLTSGTPAQKMLLLNAIAEFNQTRGPDNQITPEGFDEEIYKIKQGAFNTNADLFNSIPKNDFSKSDKATGETADVSKDFEAGAQDFSDIKINEAELDAAINADLKKDNGSSKPTPPQP